MAGSTFGTVYRVTTWGESHGKALGAVIDGCPVGLELSEEDLQSFLDRRKPGQNTFTTSRREADEAEILSGVFEGRTTGTPICVLIRNEDQRSRDYSEIAKYYRPGHADITFDEKYGFRDYRGGGRSSGRETAGRVIAGAVASKVLSQLGVTVRAWVSQIGPVCCDPARFDTDRILSGPLYMPDPLAQEQAAAYLEECRRRQDSAGSVVTCKAYGLPAGIGEPVFDKLDARLAKAMMGIGAVKAVEIGDGTRAVYARGSENNDQAGAKTNHAGGVLGGISTGEDLIIRVTFKPTPSIAQPQQAQFKDGSIREVKIGGRHDPVIGPRAAVVVESMAAITLLDLMLINTGARMDYLRQFYTR